MVKKYSQLLVLALLVSALTTIRQEDFVPGPPGMKDTTVYSGYLDTYQNDRKLHYVFVQAETDADKAPLTIWLNGGPGCSSLIGFMQQIGPYNVGDTYNFGDDLIKNEYRWNRASNILFIESPGGVGFSTDTNRQINYNDRQTADDCFEAVKDFLWKVAPEFTNRPIYISGQSYAGKYIPDLAVRIIDHNRLSNVTYINLKGLLIGNPIMDHTDNSLTKNKIQYMIDQQFVSPRLQAIYHSACMTDFFSPRCEYFKYEFDLLIEDLNRYDVYEVCEATGGSTEDVRLRLWLDKVQDTMRQIHRQKKYGQNTQKPITKTISLKDIPSCPLDNGMQDYLNIHKAIYHVAWVNKTWQSCSDINYDILVEASMEQFRQIFLNKGVKVWIYSGDWDDVVPYTDTVDHLNTLKRKRQGNLEPWFIGDVHAGFYQLYDSLTLVTVKGAGHQVPTFRPQAGYQMFYNFINDKPINSPVQVEKDE